MQNNEPEFSLAATERWPPEGASEPPEWNMPGWGTTIWRGVCCRCPACGRSAIFNGYLKVYPRCVSCGAPLGDMPSDDAPPYIAMLVVLHFVAAVVVMIFRYGWHPAPWEYAVLLILLVLVCMVALRMAKGGVIGILLKLGMKRPVLG